MKIEHVAIYVNELEAARDFFVHYLGGVSNEGYYNPKTGFRSYFISFDDGARLEVMKKPGLQAADRTTDRMGYAHLAFSLGSKEKVDALTARLQADGFPLVSGPRITGDGYYESCLLGIEGNVIELTV